MGEVSTGGARLSAQRIAKCESGDSALPAGVSRRGSQSSGFTLGSARYVLREREAKRWACHVGFLAERVGAPLSSKTTSALRGGLEQNSKRKPPAIGGAPGKNRRASFR